MVLGGHQALEPIPHEVLSPLELAEELLQGSQGDVRLQRHRFDALLGQVGELPSDVDAQVGASVLATEAVAELVEELNELGLETTDLVGVHDLPSVNRWQSIASLHEGVGARSS